MENSLEALKPVAGTFNVEELVLLVKQGKIRIPAFQRGLKWESKQVVELFDSIYKSYPVGSLLLQKNKASAAKISIGPLVINAPEINDALWVIDGQQRITALAACLLRSTPNTSPPSDAFVIYFDALKKTFEFQSGIKAIDPSWVPVPQLFDSSNLSEWVFNWQYGHDPVMRSTVFDAGTRIRQYSVPHYTIDTDKEEVLKDIFYRINNTGKSLDWSEVHDALFGKLDEIPSTLSALAEELSQLGMGHPDRNQLLLCLIAYQGLDVTRSIAEHYRKNSSVLQNTVMEALPAIRKVLSFLSIEAKIPHLRLLPKALPLIVLTRFFRLFPNPNQRTIQLLVRWTWRTLLGAALFNERTLLRRSISLIKGNEEESIQAMIKLIPNSIPKELEFKLPMRFDARASETRISLVNLASLNPLSFSNKQLIDVPSLIEAENLLAFREVISSKRLKSPLLKSLANRIFLPGTGLAMQELIDTPYEENEKVFLSHGINHDTWQTLVRGDLNGFLKKRFDFLEYAVKKMTNNLASWSRVDRPSINFLLSLSPRD